MLNDLPTTDSIAELTDEAIERIKARYFLIKDTAAWRTGTQALSDAYGLLFEDDGLDLLEDEVKLRTEEIPVLLAVRWYYLAFKDEEGLVPVQRRALVSPWAARHA